MIAFKKITKLRSADARYNCLFSNALSVRAKHEAILHIKVLCCGLL